MSPPSSARPLETGAVLPGGYTVGRRVGEGGMGVVFAAERAGERVAVKILLPEHDGQAEAMGRFEREARTLAKIDSAHVCRVYDVGRHEGAPFMVMELVDGGELAHQLELRGSLTVEEAVDYVLQLCEGVAEAHIRGIVHRDLKPENVMVTGSPSAPALKLLDFGLSKDWTETGGRKRQLTATEQTMGTPHYMAPEQWLSAGHVGPAADQWALAVMLYEMIAGSVPFRGEKIAHVCTEVLHGHPDPLEMHRTDAPVGLSAVFAKSLEKNPDERYEDVGAFALAISAFGAPGASEQAQRIAMRMTERPRRACWASRLPSTPAIIVSRYAPPAMSRGRPRSTFARVSASRWSFPPWPRLR